MTALWGGIVVMIVTCFALKYAGLSVPQSILQHALTVRAVELIPAGLLGALIAVQVFADGSSVQVDARLLALGVAAVLLTLRVPFLPMVVIAAAVAALVRQL
ncbi:AzlD domain-containing protein [Aeromicrobium wangtongii]|uniref:AzlD domain-containing protein n=1 Tax=Aeromicrobium wangtongii TaxID=2969247 RepID=A0ABY5M5W5_9ACTN|nr:AzlD domain-containing protein [Aeromicrobium wangtongii]MCD9198427.1 AzlD domain-containing protein [Aeromicrobium wangtongii]MCL3818888.1 AzlD domain-containing protein [Aeromicrobium wangtongii]UUP12456.1 AzlD domain-containing protein [Aeromicrobium wangtongii]